MSTPGHPQLGLEMTMQKKRGKKKLIVGIVAVAVVALAAVLIVTQAVMPRLAGKGDPIYVPDEVTLTSDGWSSSWTHEHDAQGNLTSSRISDGAESVGSVTYVLDDYGYATSCAYSDEYGQETIATFDNVIDDRGRLTRSVMTIPGGDDDLIARYTYYGDTDNLEEVSYSFSDWYSPEVGFIMNSLVMYPGLGRLAVYEEFYETPYTATLHFSEEGVLQTATVNGGAPMTVSSGALDELRNLSTASGDWSFIWDENGNLTSLVNPYVNSGLYQTFSEVDSPSRAVTIFGRLHVDVPGLSTFFY